MAFVSQLRLYAASFVAVAAAVVVTPAPAHAQLYTTYNFANTGFRWVTCGSTAQSEGCYGSGSVSSYGHLCAIVEDGASGTTYDNKQHIFALDSNATGKNDVVLHILTKAISVDQSGYAHTAFNVFKDVNLPLAGGNNAKCYMAANQAVIIAGTSTSTGAAYVPRKTLVASGGGSGFSPPELLTGITLDAAGYITVNFQDGFYLIGPNGSGVEDGGGNAFLIPRGNALTR